MKKAAYFGCIKHAQSPNTEEYATRYEATIESIPFRSSAVSDPPASQDVLTATCVMGRRRC